MEWLVNNLGSIITLSSFFLVNIVATAVTITTIRSDVKHIDNRMVRLEKETSDLKDVVIELAKQEGRIHALEQVIIQQGQRLDTTALRIDKLIQESYE